MRTFFRAAAACAALAAATHAGAVPLGKLYAHLVLPLGPDGASAVAAGPGPWMLGQTADGAGAFVEGRDGVRHPVVGIGDLPSGNAYNGINALGQATGWGPVWDENHSLIAHHAWLTGPAGGTAVDIGVPEGDANSSAYAVNAGGQVTGDSSSILNVQHAFITDAGGANIRLLGTAPGAAGRAINDAGRVTGYAPFGAEFHAVLWSADGATMVDLGTLGGKTSEGVAINERNQVAGYSFLPRNRAVHSFLTDAEGANLRDLGGPPDFIVMPVAMNRDANVVGYAQVASQDRPRRPWITGDDGTDLRDLNELAVGLHGDTLTSPTGIDDAGRVTATGGAGVWLLCPTPTCR